MNLLYWLSKHFLWSYLKIISEKKRKGNRICSIYFKRCVAPHKLEGAMVLVAAQELKNIEVVIFNLITHKNIHPCFWYLVFCAWIIKIDYIIANIKATCNDENNDDFLTMFALNIIA